MSLDGTSGGSEDDRVLVAEYALGLLDEAERAAVARRLAVDPALASELRLWRARLSTLDNEFAEVAPPAHILQRIEQRLHGAPAPARTSWWDSLPMWRSFAGITAAIAVVAVGFNMMTPRLDPDQLAVQLVAALEAQEGSGVQFVAVYDQYRGEVRITSLRGDAVPEKDFELWYIKGDEPAVSMGVIPVDQRFEIPLDATAKAKFEAGTVLAVTLEQKGGSPTGVAQGPIVAVGAATPI